MIEPPWQIVETDAAVELVRADQAPKARRPARPPHPRRGLAQQLADRDAERHLVYARLLAVAGDAQNLGAGAAVVASWANQAAPFSMIFATQHSVSTLLTEVGMPR
jgi:hypothetical protein